jgi:hypothetical protein
MAQVEREANRGGGNGGGGDSGDNSEPVSVGEIGQARARAIRRPTGR